MTRSTALSLALGNLSGVVVTTILALVVWFGVLRPTSPEIRPKTVTADARLTAERDSALALVDAEAARADSLQHVADFRDAQIARESTAAAEAEDQAARSDRARQRANTEADRANADASALRDSLDALAPDASPDWQAAYRTTDAALQTTRAALDSTRAYAADLDTVTVRQRALIATQAEAIEVRDDVIESLETTNAAERDARLAADARGDLWQTEARHQSRAAARWKTAAKVGTAVAFVGGFLASTLTR